jgi:hypothetical protein
MHPPDAKVIHKQDGSWAGYEKQEGGISFHTGRTGAQNSNGDGKEKDQKLYPNFITRRPVDKKRSPKIARIGTGFIHRLERLGIQPLDRF